MFFEIKRARRVLQGNRWFLNSCGKLSGNPAHDAFVKKTSNRFNFERDKSLQGFESRSASTRQLEMVENPLQKLTSGHQTACFFHAASDATTH